MTDLQTITLGGAIFAVPALPLRINRKAYPLCQKLHNGGFVTRWLTAIKDDTPISAVEVSEDEADDLAEFAFLVATAALPSLTRETFDDLPITPIELYNALILARAQTGVWVPIASGEASDAPGEAGGPTAPPT